MNLPQSTLAWLCLAGAILFEVLGTTFLGKSEQFTRLVPSLVAFAAYCVSFYLVAQALRSIPLGIAYAIWAGVGIILTLIVGLVVFRQRPDMAAVFGVALIVGGVVVVNVFSKMSVH